MFVELNEAEVREAIALYLREKKLSCTAWDVSEIAISSGRASAVVEPKPQNSVPQPAPPIPSY